MKFKRIVILGGTGFVGHSLCNRLVREGYQLKVLTRNRASKCSDLIILPGLRLIEADVYHQAQLNAQLAGSDVVINLIGLLNEPGNKGTGFIQAHVELAQRLLVACRHNHIRRILQMSALQADALHGRSHYLRSKGRAEDLLHQDGGIQVTSFRPSIIFGDRDNFFNRFAKLARAIPCCLPLPCYASRFSPIYVLDVVEMMARTINDPNSYGKRLSLCGPKTYRLEELVRYMLHQTGTRRILLPLPDGLSRLQAYLFDLLGELFQLVGMEKPFSMDNYHSASQDSVCVQNDLSSYNITPTPIEAVVPRYLARQTTKDRYHQLRKTTSR